MEQPHPEKWKCNHRSPMRRCSSSSIITASSTIVRELIGYRDLVVEILSRLPAKSVIRFRAVCKEWLSLTSDPVFLRIHTRRNPNQPISGLLLCLGDRRLDYPRSGYDAFSIDGSTVMPDPNQTLVDIAKGKRPLFFDSCNGLLLCRGTVDPNYYVCNLTIKAYRQIPIPTYPGNGFHTCVNLVFDPSRSTDRYQLFCWYPLPPDHRHMWGLAVYSSDTGSWTEPSPDNVFNLSDCLFIKRGVYWNGAMNYISTHRFIWINVDGQHQINTRPMPSAFDDERNEVLYFQVSAGRLCTIIADKGLDHGFRRFYDTFDIWEMKKDYSGWSLLYNVDVSHLKGVYPGIASRRYPMGSSLDWDLDRAPTYPLLFLPKAQAEEHREVEMVKLDTLLLSIPGKIVYYELERQSVERDCPVLPRYFKVCGFYDPLYCLWSNVPFSFTLFPP